MSDYRFNMIGRLVNDEMNRVQSMGLDELDDYIRGLITAILDNKTDQELIILDNELLVSEAL